MEGFFSLSTARFGQYIYKISHFLMEMFLALLPMVYIFLSLFVVLECALILMTLTTETYF